MIYSLLHTLAIISILLIPSAPFDFQDVIFISLYTNVCVNRYYEHIKVVVKAVILFL